MLCFQLKCGQPTQLSAALTCVLSCALAQSQERETELQERLASLTAILGNSTPNTSSMLVGEELPASACPSSTEEQHQQIQSLRAAAADHAKARFELIGQLEAEQQRVIVADRNASTAVAEAAAVNQRLEELTKQVAQMTADRRVSEQNMVAAAQRTAALETQLGQVQAALEASKAEIITLTTSAGECWVSIHVDLHVIACHYGTSVPMLCCYSVWQHQRLVSDDARLLF